MTKKINSSSFWPLKEETKLFLDELYLGQRGLIEIRCIAKYPMGQKTMPSFYKSSEQINGMKLIHLNSGKGFNIYFGVALRQKPRGAKENILEIGSLWADLDGKQFHYNIEQGKQIALKSALEKLPEFLRPSVIVDSGNGFHCYWLLVFPAPVGTIKERGQFESINRGLSQFLGGDHTWNVDRILRLPNTSNVKQFYNRKSCKIIEADYNRRYDLSDFEHLAVQVVATPSPAVVLASRLPQVELGKLLVNARIINLIKNGKTDNDGYKSRSEADIAVTLALVRAGHSDNEIAAVFANPAWKIGKKYRGE